MKKRTVIQRCNSWINSPGKAGKQWKEVSVSLPFDFVFVYLRPHFGEGGYCAQRRRVPVPRSRLLIKPLFVGTYLQVTWWAPSQWKGGKNPLNDKYNWLQTVISDYNFTQQSELLIQKEWTGNLQWHGYTHAYFASTQWLVTHLFQTNLNTQIMLCSLYSRPFIIWIQVILVGIYGLPARITINYVQFTNTW